MVGPKYQGIFGKTSSVGWVAKFDELKAALEEYYKFEAVLTPYERDTISREIKARMERDGEYIRQGAIGEYRSKLMEFQKAQAAHKKEIEREANRWDTGKLSGEMAFVNQRIEAALGTGNDPVSEFKALFEDAKVSGDRHKIRAAAEALRGALGKVKTDNMDTRRALNLLGKQADAELRQMRVTPEMEKAEEAAKAAFERVRPDRWQARFTQINHVLTGGRPEVDGWAGTDFERELNRLQVDQNTGEWRINWDGV